ncbi:hypothetical protein EDD36DRAFT_54398 [Exophiala viscosa]|uniref:Transcription factor domain-containing protein n=1 Tax=Exophiala viscosa TaxID=2486360 RepID=A0AAN6DQM4_9EURO|nr:hypothetical protein EDD36DRAFT_54398 [Exophiala viscosa]
MVDRDDLPDLKLSGKGELYSTRFRIFLSLRYLTSRVLFYRPLLDLHLELEPHEYLLVNSEPLGDIMLTLLKDCAKSCRLVIDIAKGVLRASGEGVNIQGAWWLSAHFVFNASLVLLGINLAMRQSGDISSHSWVTTALIENRNSVSDAVAVMRGLDRGNAVIARCRNALVTLAKSYDASEPDSLPGPDVAMLNREQGPSSSSQTGQDVQHEVDNYLPLDYNFDELASYSNFNFFSDPPHLY